MEIFSALLAICAGNSPVTAEFPTQMPVTRSFDVFFDLRLNKRLSKQSWGWWLETPTRPLWRHRNVCAMLSMRHRVSYPTAGPLFKGRKRSREIPKPREWVLKWSQRQHRRWDACQISQRSGIFKRKFRGFEIGRDLAAARCIIA